MKEDKEQSFKEALENANDYFTDYFRKVEKRREKQL